MGNVGNGGYMFRLHEIVIGQNFVLDTFRNGLECEIIEPLKMVTSSNTVTKEITTAMRYKVKWADGSNTAQESRFLRKLPPPNTKTEWEDCEFKPRELVDV